MKRVALILTATLLTVPFALVAQVTQYSSSLLSSDPAADGGGAQTYSPVRYSSGGGSVAPFTKVGFSGGISPLGIELQAATNISSHFNVRGTGNFFSYNENFTSNGITATGSLNLNSAGIAVDYYPFHNGFHVSPGVLLRNGNQVTANANVPAGSSFTLNGTTYYSANANATTGATPIVGSGVLALNTTKPAFTATAGWGNIAHGNGHWSVPVDVGAAFVGAPSVKVNLSGWACYDQAETECASIADTTNPIGAQVQSNLTAQVAKWTNDLNPLKTYPIVSVGLAYSFRVSNR